jgi:uncharacterized protein (DUF2235 family)
MRRLIALCDGTWLHQQSPRPGNIAQLARLILPRSRDGVSQLIHYQAGTGCDGEPAPGDAAGVASRIDRDIQSLYRFIVHNYQKGDELYLFGFSRGAYIARSCIGMLRNAWLLRREHSEWIAHAYHIYRTLWHADADNAVRFREPLAVPVSIRFLGVWDTVGDRGIPLPLFKGLDAERYGFHDNRLSRIVEHACHAVAIDERRAVFAPCLWKTRFERERTQQVWFAGSHLDIGGGHREAGLSYISLRWMIEQAAQCGLETNRRALDELCCTFAQETVHDSLTGAHADKEFEERKIGSCNADETLHASAEQRYLHRRRYRPRNLVEYLARDEQIRLPL